MQAKVYLPGQLVELAGGEEIVSVGGQTIGEALGELVAKHPELHDRLFTERGLKRFVNIYLGDEDIRLLEGLDTELEENAEINIVPAIAGGARYARSRQW